MIDSLPAVRHRIRTLHTHQSGARSVVVHDPAAMNCTVALAIPVGMRDEAPGEQGMMHLLEHVVYQDSDKLTTAERSKHIQRSGGVLGGHTHMDYTEFYETGSPSDVTQMLARVFDQVFAPAFLPSQISEQIQAVATERATRLGAAPGGMLPWPHLTGRFWQDHPNQHDGSGDLDLADRASADVLRALHARYYSLATVVVVVVSPLPEEHVVPHLAELLGQVREGALAQPHKKPARGLPANPTHEVVPIPNLKNTRRISVTALSPVETPTPAVLGEQLAAAALRAQHQVDVSAGLFGPGDLALDDLFVVVDDTGLALDLAERLRLLPELSDHELKAAAHRALYAIEQLTRDDERFARTLARDLLLRGNSTFSSDLCAALAMVTSDLDRARTLMTQASQRLSQQPSVSLTLTPEEYSS